MIKHSYRVVSFGAAGCVLLLAGCASVPADRGVSKSIDLVTSHAAVAGDMRFAQRSGQADVAAEIAELTAQPLDADGAVKLALLTNPRMQALYADLGVAQADVYDASRLSNPSVGYIRLTPSSSGEQARTTWSLTQNFTELLFLNYRVRVSRSRLLQAQQRVAQDVLALEADVRSAYYRYITANLVAQLYRQITLAANASSDYAQSLFNAGNISELQLNREQANASEMRIAEHAADSEAVRTKAELLTIIGLTTDAAQNLSFMERLDVPLHLALDSSKLRQWASEQRMDLAVLREQAELSSSVNTHAARWHWLGGVQVEAEKEHETDGTHLSGLGGSIEVPIFNQGGGNALRAQAQFEAARANLKMLELKVANGITAQMTALDNAWQRVDEYRQRLVPLREHIVELSQQQQNFMLIGAFEALAAKRDALTGYQAYLNATGDYWIQYTELQREAGGRLPDSDSQPAVGVSIGVDTLPAVSDQASQDDQEKHIDAGEHDDMSNMDHNSMHHNAASSSQDSTGGTP